MIMNKQSIQSIVARFTYVGNIYERIFTKKNVINDMNTYCFSTENGYFVLFQADYISGDNKGIEEVIFHTYTRNLHVIPQLMIKPLNGSDYQITLDMENTEKKYLNKFAVVSVALKGNTTFLRALV